MYEEADDMFYVSLHKTTSLHYVVIHIASATTSEVLLLDAELADAEPLVFLARRKDHEYSLDHYQHTFYLRSNRQGKNFGLYRTRVRDEQARETLIRRATASCWRALRCSQTGWWWKSVSGA